MELSARDAPYFRFSLYEMPDEILLEIFLFLAHPRSLHSFVRQRAVCRKFYYLLDDEILWTQLQESFNLVDAEFYVQLSVSGRIERRLMFDWFSRKRPVCDGCGQSASLVFRNMANFVLLDGPFVCPPCRKFRGLIAPPPPAKQRVDEAPPAEKPAAKNPLPLRSVPTPTVPTPAAKSLQENLAVLNKRAEILDDLARRGIKVKTGKELQDYLNGRSEMTRDQLIVLLQQRQDEADAEALRREGALKKKRDGLLLRDFKPVDISLLELGGTPRSKPAAAVRAPEAPASTLELGLAAAPRSSPSPGYTSASSATRTSKGLFANHKPLPSVLPPITSMVRPATPSSASAMSPATPRSMTPRSMTPRTLSPLNRSPATPPSQSTQ